MPRLQDRYRLIRLKGALTDDGPWAGLDHPDPGDVTSVRWLPANRLFVFLVPVDSDDEAIEDDNSGTCTVTAIKIADIDHDGSVDATDIAVRTASLPNVPYYTEFEVGIGGSLRYTVEITGSANPATGQEGIAIYVRESSE